MDETLPGQAALAELRRLLSEFIIKESQLTASHCTDGQAVLHNRNVVSKLEETLVRLEDELKAESIRHKLERSADKDRFQTLQQKLQRTQRDPNELDDLGLYKRKVSFQHSGIRSLEFT